MAGRLDTFDYQVRRHIYKQAITHGQIPRVAETAAALASTPAEVASAQQRLAAGHVIVLQQGSPEILMANPFSAVPTAFQVQVAGRAYWGNCSWDALGILAMLQADGQVITACPDCGDALELTVKEGALVDSAEIAHFTVPARQWWDNIVFT